MADENLSGGEAEGVFTRISGYYVSVVIVPYLVLREEGNARDIKKPVLILVLLVDTAHQRRCRRQDLINEDKDGLLRGKLDALADDVDELADGKVGGDQVFLLVDSGDVGFFDFFTDDLFRDVSESLLAQREAVRLRRPLEGRKLTGMRSAYFWRIRSASALRFSKGCSSLNFERMVMDEVELGSMRLVELLVVDGKGRLR